MAGLAVALIPAVAQAQPRGDAAGTVGLFAGHAPTQDRQGYQDTWFHAVEGGVVVGVYVSPHVKVEFDASTTGNGRQTLQRFIGVPGLPYPYPVAYEAITSQRALAASAVWQFRDNAWVHPFVQAGVTTDIEERSLRTWEQFAYLPDARQTTLVRVNTEGIEGSRRDVRVRALVGAGAKLYVAPRAFFRTDGRVTFGADRQNVSLRVGFGVDF